MLFCFLLLDGCEVQKPAYTRLNNSKSIYLELIDVFECIVT